MKKFFFASFVLLMGTAAFSQKLASSKVPQAAKDAFAKAHPNTTAAWEREDANYEANFKEGGKAMSCVIDKRGTILETESPVTEAELPAAAKTYVAQHYKGKKAKEVAKIARANGEINYEVNYGGGDVLFDAAGKRINKGEKKEKD